MRTNNNGTIWTVKMVKFFSDLCADENRTFRSIMKAMNAEFSCNLTRNACIGKARRLRAPPRAPINDPVETRPTIYQLRNHHCKNPVGSVNNDNRPPYLYCGKRTTGHGSWCKECQKLMFSKGPTYIAKTYPLG